MKKLFTILALVSFMGIFSACEEEEILPETEVTENGNNPTSDDPNQWD